MGQAGQPRAERARNRRGSPGRPAVDVIVLDSAAALPRYLPEVGPLVHPSLLLQRRTRRGRPNPPPNPKECAVTRRKPIGAPRKASASSSSASAPRPVALKHSSASSGGSLREVGWPTSSCSTSPRAREQLPADIPSRATTLPVTLARDGQRIERDHVYVIPPGPGLIVEDGALRLVASERNGTRMLVNGFLTSLAEDQRENAVGIVLGDRLRRSPRHRRREEARGQDVRAAPWGRALREHARRRDRHGDGRAGAPGRRDPGGTPRAAAERRRHPPGEPARRGGGLRQALEVVARTRGTTSAGTSGARSFAVSTGGWPLRASRPSGSTPP